MRLFHYSAIYVKVSVPEMRLFLCDSMIQKKNSNKPYLSGNKIPIFDVVKEVY